jgi:hypothetical protein
MDRRFSRLVAVVFVVGDLGVHGDAREPAREVSGEPLPRHVSHVHDDQVVREDDGVWFVRGDARDVPRGPIDVVRVADVVR